MDPTIGRIVIYRSRTGDYSVPAIVTATAGSLNPKGVELGHVPSITGYLNVHLTVFTPGKPGMRGDALDLLLVAGDEPLSENVSGCYQEWDVPPDNDPFGDQSPGTWSWPPRS